MHSISSSTSTNQPIHFLNSQLTFQSKIQYIDQNLTTVRERSIDRQGWILIWQTPSHHLKTPSSTTSLYHPSLHPPPLFFWWWLGFSNVGLKTERERETSDQHVRRHKSLLDLYCIRNGRSTPVLINGWSNGESSSEGTLKGSSSKELRVTLLLNSISPSDLLWTFSIRRELTGWNQTSRLIREALQNLFWFFYSTPVTFLNKSRQVHFFPQDSSWWSRFRSFSAVTSTIKHLGIYLELTVSWLVL